ncbi:MAG: 3-phosphoshikimate 1-carboxyvinyltransferase [Nitrospiraceae bacterium]|nr:MAG: 3-phosphoshikimate 1-carboxyvinyltransferase [Nitrospiraceae bacterium]
MSQISIRHRGPLQGEIKPPADKSISHRAIMLASLAEGKSSIRNSLQAEDPVSTLKAFRQMGIDIDDKDSDRIIINGKGLRGLTAPRDNIDCGNSGTTMRLLSGILSAQPFTSVLTGDKFLLRRPMRRIIKPLSEMGAHISSEKGGRPPLTIKGGNLIAITYHSPVASAQVKSAILFAGLYCEGCTTVIEPGKSRDHTERMLTSCGADINIDGLEVSIQGGKGLAPFDITIPGDLSSAAFFIAAGLIVPGSDIVIKKVGINPTRTGIIDIFQKMGGDITLHNVHEVSGESVADIRVRYSELMGTDIGGDLILRAIDEFPVLCAASAIAGGVTRISGASELRVKESDRIASMAMELRKTGVHVEESEDGLAITGLDRLRHAVVQSHGDHRVAMSMAVAGLVTEGGLIIEDTECINTSFPQFPELLKSLY